MTAPRCRSILGVPQSLHVSHARCGQARRVVYNFVLAAAWSKSACGEARRTQLLSAQASPRSVWLQSCVRFPQWLRRRERRKATGLQPSRRLDRGRSFLPRGVRRRLRRLRRGADAERDRHRQLGGPAPPRLRRRHRLPRGGAGAGDAGDDDVTDTRIAIVKRPSDAAFMRLTPGSKIDGWTVSEIEPRAVVLRRDDRSVTIGMPDPPH